LTAFSVICNKTFYKVYTLLSHTPHHTKSPLGSRGRDRPLTGEWAPVRHFLSNYFDLLFCVVVEGPKGCLPAAELPATSYMGAGIPKFAQIFACGKWLYPYSMQLHGASDTDPKCLKTRNSKDGCTFPPNIFTPKPHFGGL